MMKNINRIGLLLLVIVLSSCVSVKKRVHRKGFNVQWHQQKDNNESFNTVTTDSISMEEEEVCLDENTSECETEDDFTMEKQSVETIADQQRFEIQIPSKLAVKVESRSKARSLKSINTSEELDTDKTEKKKKLFKRDFPLKWGFVLLLIALSVIPYIGLLFAIFNIVYSIQLFKYTQSYRRNADDANFVKVVSILGVASGLFVILAYAFLILLFLTW